MQDALNLLYRLVVLFLLVALGWNVVRLKEPRKQIMSALVMIPFVMRLLNLK